jgi:Flp pilus assembly protein TadB
MKITFTNKPTIYKPSIHKPYINREEGFIVNLPSEQSDRSPRTVWRKIWSALKAYLTDWRNLLGHALLGVGFVVLAVWAPISIWIKLVIIALLVAFNVFRMRNKAKSNATKEEETL